MLDNLHLYPMTLTHDLLDLDVLQKYLHTKIKFLACPNRTDI